MPKLTINGKEVTAKEGSTILQACEQIGIEIPRFCYHEYLSISGNCRMCLVEVERFPKLVTSCSLPVSEGMVVYTDTARVRRAREHVMEFLLMNHPLDCPVCDQGGECDLQDLAISYGRGSSRFEGEKRIVADKNISPLIKTVMTRCIHCTRCIRFLSEVAGVDVLGMTGRGDRSEINVCAEERVSSELSGNLIDVCPVGALTSNPGVYQHRPWEYVSTESIDVMDGAGASIRIDSCAGNVARILPRFHGDVNEVWLGDRSRFIVDALRYQRLDRPWIRRNGKLEAGSWEEAFEKISLALKVCKPDEIAAISGNFVDVESLYALKGLMQSLGSGHIDCRQDGAYFDVSCRSSWLLNTTISKLEKADAILLVGTNPRIESPLVNIRLRRAAVSGGAKVGLVGLACDLTYDYEHLGEDATFLEELLSGQHSFSKILEKAQFPAIILGQGALTGSDGAAVLSLGYQLSERFNCVFEGWNGFNVLHTAAGHVGGLEMGFVPKSGCRGTFEIMEAAEKGDIRFLWLLGADELDFLRLENSFLVYQGHHGDRGACIADVVLPGLAYTEKDATYVNMEGRVQQTRRAVSGPELAKEDWRIVRAFSEVVGKALPFDSREELYNCLVTDYPIFASVDSITPSSWRVFGESGPVSTRKLCSPIHNYYRADSISRSSAVMAECAKIFTDQKEEKERN